jgi:aspartokinase
MEGIMPTVEAADDIELLAIRFARLQIEHDQRSDDEAQQRSRDAIRSWGERVPAALTDKPRAR